MSVRYLGPILGEIIARPASPAKSIVLWDAVLYYMYNWYTESTYLLQPIIPAMSATMKIADGHNHLC